MNPVSALNPYVIVEVVCMDGRANAVLATVSCYPRPIVAPQSVNHLNMASAALSPNQRRGAERVFWYSQF